MARLEVSPIILRLAKIVKGGGWTLRATVLVEVRGVAAHIEPRFRKEDDADRLLAAFPRLAECVKPAVNASWRARAMTHSAEAPVQSV